MCVSLLRYGVSSVALAALLALPNLALAQNASPAPETTQVDEIIVTGSRIARRVDDIAVPAVAVAREDLDQSGQASLDEILTEMPQMGIGTGASNTFFNYDDPGAAFANLRSLGTNRSLVLVKSRSWIPVLTSLVVEST